MKENASTFRHYESASEQVLPKDLPIIARVDGSCFSNLTEEHFAKPFDSRFEELMNAAARGVMEYCTQAEFAYIQSDEISFLLPPTEDPFLGGRTQKLSSLLAAKASAVFTQNFSSGTAAFDCRAFVLPKHKATEYFEWRQKDCFRNCVHSVAFYEIAEGANRGFATERLHGVSSDEKQELLFSEYGINVNDIPPKRKRGRTLKREDVEMPVEDYLNENKFKDLLEKGYVEKGDTVERSRIRLDEEPPQFTKRPRYIDQFLYPQNPGVA